ncbi:enoyl-CoA hydratase-related protein [Chloroflexota bacterium]
MAYKRILYEKIEDNLAKITANRPDKRNAMDDLMSEEIEGAFIQADLDDDVSVIILAGAGKDFCVGADVSIDGKEEAKGIAGKAGKIKANGPEGVKAWYYSRGKEMMTIRGVSKPTIAMVQGNCVGAGWFMASMCDLIVAAEDARFIDSLTRFSIAGMRQFVQPYDVGFRRAKWMMWTNEPLSAQEAKQIGLVLRVFPGEKLEEETLNMARQIASRSQDAVRLTKLSVNFALDLMGQRNAMSYHVMSHEMSRMLKGGRATWVDKPKQGTV